MLRLISALILLTALTTACANTQEEEPIVDVVVVEEVIEPEPAPAPVAAPPAEPIRVLPDTASQAPAVALMGFGAIAAGLLVGAVRRRL
jgi:LPXTG-motif cell wall-anchored protein